MKIEKKKIKDGYSRTLRVHIASVYGAQQRVNAAVLTSRVLEVPFLGAVRKSPPFLAADAICSRRPHKSAGGNLMQ